MNKLTFVCHTQKDESEIELAIRTVELPDGEFVTTTNGDGLMLLSYKDYMGMDNVIIKKKMQFLLRDLESKN